MSYFGGLCRTIGTIIGRTRKDGSKAFTAQIVIKKGGAIVHREAETFDRKQAANAWIVRHEAELKRPGGLERKEDPTLASVIDRYIAESKNAELGTKAQVLKTIKNGELGETAHAKDCGFRALLNAKTRRDHVAAMGRPYSRQRHEAPRRQEGKRSVVRAGDRGTCGHTIDASRCTEDIPLLYRCDQRRFYAHMPISRYRRFAIS